MDRKEGGTRQGGDRRRHKFELGGGFSSAVQNRPRPPGCCHDNRQQVRRCSESGDTCERRSHLCYPPVCIIKGGHEESQVGIIAVLCLARRSHGNGSLNRPDHLKTLLSRAVLFPDRPSAAIPVFSAGFFHLCVFHQSFQLSGRRRRSRERR